MKRLITDDIPRAVPPKETSQTVGQEQQKAGASFDPSLFLPVMLLLFQTLTGCSFA